MNLKRFRARVGALIDKIIPMGAKATGEVERDHWQTPKYILDKVTKLFAWDWWDPCPANPTYDGLAIDWPPVCYINPPFSEYDKWVKHALSQTHTPGLTEQIWISHTNNSTGWYKQLLAASSAVILLDHRVRFVDPKTGQPSKQTAFGKSQTLFYIGHRPEEFVKVFGELGQALVKPESRCFHRLR